MIFKPAEIRIILVLAILALVGSAIVLLQRQGKMSQFNLAAVSDNSQYRYKYTPSDFKAQNPANQAALPDSNQSQATTSPDAKIDLNHCGYYDFEALPGIGPALASRIIAYRDSVGHFTTIDELRKVKGIGPVKFAAIKDKVTL